IKAALVQMGQRVRVYTPYGELLPGMAYLVRRLLENTANQSFLRAGFVEHVPEEQLLMNPQHASSQWSVVSGQNAIGQQTDGVAGATAGTHLRNGHGQIATGFKNEPVTDFSREANQQKMREALQGVVRQFGATFPLVIGGQKVTTAKTMASVNPSHRKQVVGHTALAEPVHAEQAVSAAAKAFEAWRDAPPETRAACLSAAARLMRQRRFELAAWEVYECGKQCARPMPTSPRRSISANTTRWRCFVWRNHSAAI